VRALVKGGFADLHHPEYFELDWAARSPLAEEYHRMVETINESLRFTEHVLGVRAGATDRIDFYTCHEALHLGSEEAQTRHVPRRAGYFNLATHFPGSDSAPTRRRRARRIHAGHRNPIGIKVGPGTTRESIGRWLEALDPARQPGRLTLIHRCGARRIADELPALIEATRAEGGNVLWIADPMHGNTQTTPAE